MTAAALLGTGSVARAATIWTPLSSGTTDTISAIVYQSPTRFWYATTNGKIEYFNGSSFVAGTGPLAGTNFTDLAFQPGATGGPGTAGVYGYAVVNDGRIFQTSNGGIVWTPVPPPLTPSDCSVGATSAAEHELNAVVWADSTTAYLLGDNGTVLKATNANTATPSFTEINKVDTGTCATQGTTTPETMTDAAFLPANPLTGFLISQDFGALYSTSNGFGTGGIHRSDMINNYTGDPRIAQDAANPNRIWAVDHSPGGGGCGTLCFALSTDGGQTFGHPTYPQYANSSTSPTLGLYDVTSQGGVEIAAGSAGEIFSSVDGTNFYNQPAAGALATENWLAADAYDAAHAAVGGVGGALVVTAAANTIPDIIPPTGSIVGPTTVTSGTAVTYAAAVADNAGGSGISPSGYTWTVPGFPAQHGSSAAYTFPKGTGSATITVSFTDNAGNQATATLDVTVKDAGPPVSIGAAGTSNGTTVTITVSCAATPCTVTVTITGTSTSHTRRALSARTKKAKAVTIATGTFTIKKTGKAKLAVKLTKAGKRLLKKNHGHLKAKTVVSTKLGGHVQKVSKTIHITTKKK
ncbi:MAG TPA: hypothetical protein VG294_07030 [Solirubrobacteraceae bacterium]|jgi:hypothetical protein|nr:hypothetical protein [Solirubrobacteraceae bacterium]